MSANDIEYALLRRIADEHAGKVVRAKAEFFREDGTRVEVIEVAPVTSALPTSPAAPSPSQSDAS